METQKAINRGILERPITPILFQVCIIVDLLSFVYDGFFEIPLRKYLVVFLTLLILVSSLWYLRNQITWIDLLVLGFIIFLLFYSRFYTQAGHKSLLRMLTFPLTGYSFGLLIIYTKWPGRSMYLYSLFALLPFIFAFLVLNTRLDNDSYFYNMNRNTISLLLIFATSLLSVNEYMNNQRLSILPIALTVLCSFFSKSRTGLALSLLLFFLVVATVWTSIWNSLGNKKPGSKPKVSFLLLSSIFIVSFLVLSFFLVRNSRFVTVGLQSSGRVEIYKTFLSELTTKKMFLGFHPEILNSIRLHNSYFTYLAFFGAFSLVIIFIYGFSFVMFIRKAPFLFGLLSLFSVYSLVESISPYDVGDFLLIPLFLIAFHLHNSKAWWLNHPPVETWWRKIQKKRDI